MAKRLLFIGWEAADWRVLRPLMDSGRMPALSRLVGAGASGTLLSGRPLVPAAQWTTLVTGKRPWQHGVCLQVQLEGDPQRPVPVSASSRNSATLWDILGREGKRALIVGWPATHGSRGEHTLVVSNRYSEPTAGPGVKPWPPAISGTYWPDQLRANLDPLRVSPEDVQSDLISRCVPGWQQVDQKRDRRLGNLRVFFAADLSHHAAMVRLLSTREWEFAAIHYPALGAISALFLPYLAPKRDWVSQPEFDTYQHVLPAACMILDRLLHQLLKAAGEGTAIVLASAQGVNPALPQHYLRTRDNELWKSPYGIVAVSGPGFRPDATLSGATVRDLAPTILTWFGLPIGEDMEGRALMESFAPTPEVKRIATWEGVPECGATLPHPAASGSTNSPAATRLRLESDWNLALAYLDGARYADALPLLRRLFHSFPERLEFGQALFQCQLTVKETSAAAETLTVLLEALPPGVGSRLLQLELLLAQGHRQDARALADEVQSLKPADPDSLRRLGMCLWRLREWRALADLARQALQRDENEPLAWLALAEASLRLREPAKAVEAARRSIGMDYFQPQAHLALARALVTQGKWAEAREAMQTVMRLQPNNRAADAYSRRTGLAEGGTRPQ